MSGPSRAAKSRKKLKSKFNFFRSFLVIFLVLAAGSTIYFSRDTISQFFEKDEKVSVAKEEKPAVAPPVEEVEEPADTRDIRYVHIEAGFVRDAPDLENSTKITMVNFGDSIIVEEIATDPAQDFNWLKFTLPNGQVGWISERLVTQVETPVDEAALMTGIEDLTQMQGFASSLEILGKTEEELQDWVDLEISYDENGLANGYTADLNELSKESLVASVGEPAVELEESAYVYSGKDVSFILQSENGSLTSLTVKKLPEVNNF